MRILFFVFFSVLVSTNSKSQNINKTNTSNIIPPSPEVAAMGKYIDMPVTYATGTPGINIPFHTIKCGDIQIPISMNYNASGIKVEEASTWVGLGWSLSTGGSLSRVVQGLPDDFGPNGFMYTTKTTKYILGLPVGNPERYDLLYNQANNGELDVEPDTYIFSAGSYSGKFYFDQTLRNFVFSPLQNIIIAPSFDAQNRIISFKLTTPDGAQFYFGKSRDNLRTGYDLSTGQEVVASSGGTQSYPPPANALPNHITSWQIMDAVAPAGQQVSFSYNSYAATDFGRSGETKDYAGASGCSAATGIVNASYYKQFSTKAVLDKITTDLEEVNFILSAQPRLDVEGAGKSLEKIVLKDKTTMQVRAFEFEYDYFTSPDAPALPGLSDVTEKARKRLYLKSIKPFGSGTQNTPPYIFTYETGISLPSRFSPSQDYWGYFNGKQNPIDLIPKIYTSVLYGTPGGFLPGADRTVDFNYAKAGVLKKITYPTGGTTEYFFEPNKVSPVYLQSFMQGYQISGLDSKQLNFFKSTLYLVSGTSNIYRTTFSISNIEGEVKINSFFEGCDGGYSNVNCPVQAMITGITNPSFQLAVSAPEFYTILPAGAYQIEAVLTPNGNYPNPDFNIALNWSENPDPKNILVGGLRLSKVVIDDGNGGRISKSFSYQSFSDPLQSSGELINMPVHAFRIFCGTGSEQSPTVLRVVSNSSLPLTSPDGQLVRYTNVTEYNDENKTSTKSEFTFSSDHYNYPDPNGTNYPFPTHLQREWRNGLLLEKKIYEKMANGTYRVLQAEVNANISLQPKYESIFGIKLSSYPTSGSFGYTPYSYVSEWYLPNSAQSTNTSYQSVSPASQSITEIFSYNAKGLVSSQQKQNSKGELSETTLKYPFDYSTVSPYNEMINRNLITPVIEKTQKNVTSNKELNKSKINYSYFQGTTLILPSVIQSSILGNSLENESVINEYDSYGNILQVTEKGSIITSYIWGYNQRYPVAKIIGKSYSDAVSLSNVNLTVLNSLSTSELDKRMELQKLRSLANTFVSTYTYKPLVGITSETDPRGRTTYYEYDAFNRLILVKDHEGKILKKICYNYAGQVEDCNVPCPTTPVWQNTGNTRCQVSSGNQYTGYIEYEQTNTNTCINVVNQWVVQGASNTAICTPPGYGVSLTSTNTNGATGWVASYYNTVTGFTYNLNVSTATTLQALGNIPAGSYNLTIYRPAGGFASVFKSGCNKFTVSGTSVTFYNISVSSTSCNSITIMPDSSN